MPTMHLDQRRADALRPRRTAYDIRDRDLRGFGIRVRPSGRRTWFVHVRCDGERVRRTVGDAGAVAASEARKRAAELIAALRRDGAAPGDTIFEAVAGEALAHHARLWKSQTVEINRRYYRNRILPGFRGRPVAGITRRDVRAWFVSLDAVPATANRCLPILSVIMRHGGGAGPAPRRGAIRAGGSGATGSGAVGGSFRTGNCTACRLRRRSTAAGFPRQLHKKSTHTCVRPTKHRGFGPKWPCGLCSPPVRISRTHDS